MRQRNAVLLMSSTRVSLLGNFTLSLIASLLGKKQNITLYRPDYDTSAQEILSGRSAYHEFHSDVTVICLCAEALYRQYIVQKDGFADSEMAVLKSLWSRADGLILQFNFVEIDNGVYGNYAAQTSMSFLYQLRKLNSLIADYARNSAGIKIIDVQNLCLSEGYRSFHDPGLWYSSRIPYSLQAAGDVAEAVTQEIALVRGTYKKCVVIDLDNTLWGGILSEGSVRTDDDAAGRPFRDVQEWLACLRNRGVLLCLCSRNDEALVRSFFSSGRLLIGWDSFVSARINYLPKSENVRSIRDELGIAYDSMIYIDDDARERNEVRQSCPGVEAVELPPRPEGYAQCLYSVKSLSVLSEPDGNSPELYRNEGERRAEKEAYADAESWLESLSLKARACPFRQEDFGRISELSLKSNQFNMRTVRYTERQVAEIAADSGYLTLEVSVRDKFGDCGLVGFIVGRKTGPETVFIENLCMSCRVLERTVEQFMMNAFADMCRAAGVAEIQGEYLPTVRNGKVAGLYESFGFRNGRLRIKEYAPLKTYVQELDE